ncbi:nuclear transport factor 2 family protein [Mangrovimonas aestuarii]|uniref:nuclear transport factor 2 family protein n=1 Tax=Mangrovimonas aestuarii TaxID=3018443 RepID=UPI002378483F|nr:nuclear transport factor 2 family protein [Mangrovimonas aestuarii]
MYKHITQDFLKLCAFGEAQDAFSRYAAPNFKHHNAFFKGDAKTLIAAMDADAKQNPNKEFYIKHVIADGHMVAVHSHIKQYPADIGTVVMHIFRFEGGEIAELWDFGQTIPENLLNENGMF